MRNWPGLYLLSTLLFPRRSSASDAIRIAGTEYARMIRIATGGPISVDPEPTRPIDRKRFKRPCNRRIVWPTVGGGWQQWECPLPRHEGLHADENYWPAYHERDVAFMWDQYNLLHGE